MTIRKVPATNANGGLEGDLEAPPVDRGIPQRRTPQPRPGKGAHCEPLAPDHVQLDMNVATGRTLTRLSQTKTINPTTSRDQPPAPDQREHQPTRHSRRQNLNANPTSTRPSKKTATGNDSTTLL